MWVFASSLLLDRPLSRHMLSRSNLIGAGVCVACCVDGCETVSPAGCLCCCHRCTDPHDNRRNPIGAAIVFVFTHLRDFWESREDSQNGRDLTPPVAVSL